MPNRRDTTRDAFSPLPVKPSIFHWRGFTGEAVMRILSDDRPQSLFPASGTLRLSAAVVVCVALAHPLAAQTGAAAAEDPQAGAEQGDAKLRIEGHLGDWRL